MSKQYNKEIKRKRRLNYLKRKKEREQTAMLLDKASGKKAASSDKPKKKAAAKKAPAKKAAAKKAPAKKAAAKKAPAKKAAAKKKAPAKKKTAADKSDS